MPREVQWKRGGTTTGTMSSSRRRRSADSDSDDYDDNDDVEENESEDDDSAAPEECNIETSIENSNNEPNEISKNEDDARQDSELPEPTSAAKGKSYSKEPRQKNPTFVPRATRFFLHDDRGEKHKGRGRGGRHSKRSSMPANDDTSSWKHDKFDELQQEPERPLSQREGNNNRRGRRGRGKGRRESAESGRKNQPSGVAEHKEPRLKASAPEFKPSKSVSPELLERVASPHIATANSSGSSGVSSGGAKPFTADAPEFRPSADYSSPSFPPHSRHQRHYNRSRGRGRGGYYAYAYPSYGMEYSGEYADYSEYMPSTDPNYDTSMMVPPPPGYYYSPPHHLYGAPPAEYAPTSAAMTSSPQTHATAMTAPETYTSQH